MTYPTKPPVAYDYVTYQAGAPTDPLPATEVAGDFADHKAAIDAAIEFSKVVQRSDGNLQNGIVRPESLSSGTLALITAGAVWRGAWLTATAYAVNDIVSQSGNNYIGLVAHTSGVFATDLAAGKWQAVDSGNAKLTADQTFTGVNTYSGAVNFDGAVDFDSTVDMTGATVIVPTATEGDADTSAASTLFAAIAAALPPQGRLTLVTGVPIMVSSQASKTIAYYTPYVGNRVLINNGTSFVSTSFAEVSNDTTASSTGKAGPAAVTVNKNYDLFVWNDSGTVRLTRGGPWNSDTVRSATTENDLQRVRGILTNLNAITNGPAANRGTYVGTVRSDGSSQLNWIPGALGANGTAAVLGVWNMYNRVLVEGLVADNTDSWNYTTATWRPANNSTTMRVSFLQGLQEDSFEAEYMAVTTQSGTAPVNAGIGYDVTNAKSGRASSLPSDANGSSVTGDHRIQTLGFHFMQALEISAASGTTTWYGDGGGTTFQSGLIYRGHF